MSLSKNPLLALFVASCLFLSLPGCGGLLHPDRHRDTRSNQIDPVAVVLDCAWLFVFVVPGLIALGVDFYNETAYFSRSELKVSAGDRVYLRFHGKPLKDAAVAFSLVDPEGCDHEVVSEGWARKGLLSPKHLGLVIPSGVPIDGSRLVLTVDGKEQVFWDLIQRV